MTRPRIVRRLRIAVSAVGLILCIAFMVRWVRSFWFSDALNVTLSNAKRYGGMISIMGRVIVSQFSQPASYPKILRDQYPKTLLSVHSGSVAEQIESLKRSNKGLTDDRIAETIGLPRFPGFGLTSIFRGAGFRLVVPHWSLVSVAALLAAAPWLHWSRRFSLRTLLLATTLVAVVLGLVVAMR